LIRRKGGTGKHRLSGGKRVDPMTRIQKVVESSNQRELLKKKVESVFPNGKERT